MSDRHAFLLSPYRPPTSYPVTLSTNECAAWLNAYAVLWHPAVLKLIAAPPQPASVYDHDLPAEAAIYVVPEGPTVYQADDWSERVKSVHARAFVATENRTQTLRNLQDSLSEANEWLEVDPELIRLFAGLGYGYLMIDTLFDAMSHDKLLDAEGFWNDVRDAIEQIHIPSEARTKLRAAAEKLSQAREGAHSGSIFAMEWIMPDPANLGAAWPAALTRGLPVSLISDARLLERMAEQEPDRFQELKSRVPADLPASVDLCVGAYSERDDALVAVESQLWNLIRGRKAIHNLFGVEPTIFARRTSAFHPQLPSWLALAGYRHGVAVSFDGATLPSRYSSVVGWPGPDGKSIDVFTRDPLPASDPITFFNYAYHLHQAITHDSTPTLALLHKAPPGEGYDDFLALAELGSVLGESATLSRYFSETYAGDYAGVASADEFFTDYLDDRVTNRHRPDPVSGFARHHRLRRRLDSVYALASLYRTLNAPTPDDIATLERLDTIENAIELRGPNPGPADVPDELLNQLVETESAIAQPLSQRVQVRAKENQPGTMIWNGCGFARRVTIELAGQNGPIPVEGPVKACEFSGGILRAVVEVPGLGFAWIPKGSESTTVPKTRFKTAELTTVRNEFLEAELDPGTGGLRALRDTKTRINRFGEYLVFNPGSKVIATSVEITNAGAAMGEVTSKGRIENEHGELLADFQQRIRAWIGRPVLELSIDLKPHHKPVGYPWHAFYAARFGWRDDRAATFRSTNGLSTQSTHARPVTPDTIEIRLGKERTFLFTGGLPFVQRHGQRMLDVVLVPEGETETHFELLIAMDREHPMQTATGWITPPTIVETTKGPPHIGATGWLGNLDLPSFQLTSLRPVSSTSRIIEARMHETAGFAGAAELRFARDPISAKLVDLAGQSLNDVMLLEGAIPMEFSAGEVVTIQAEFA